jgi:glycosyltransferase involved in cell wall biosynthesis
VRILELAPLWEAVPPPAYGGTEAVVALLTEQLVARGHDVTLAASGDSTTTAHHFAVYHRSLRRADDLHDRDPYDWTHIAISLAQARDFDIVHNHAGELAMAMCALVDVPVLTTMHCLPTIDTQFIWDRYTGSYNTISAAQRRPVGSDRPARFMGYVHNAIDVDTFPFQAEKGEDLLFLSRIAPEKGPQIAIEAARRLGRRLIIAGKVDRYDRDFFDEVIRDEIDGEQILYVGEADATQKRELYRSAYCLLMPLTWEEPFGLVMPEAMACGTPVVALRRGSAAEIIDHGRTGFVVDNIDELVEAVRDVPKIDPHACRDHVRTHFSPGIMADRYVHLYESILGKAQLGALTVSPPLIPDWMKEGVVA